MNGAGRIADLTALAWSRDQLGEALERLAQHRGLSPSAGTTRVGPLLPPPEADSEAFADWMAAAGVRIGLEVHPEEVIYGRRGAALRGLVACLIPLGGPGAPRYLAVLGGRRLVILGPGLGRHSISPDDLAAALCAGLEGPRRDDMRTLALACGLSGRRQARASEALLAAQLREAPLGVWWHVGPSLRTPLSRQAREAGLVRRLVVLLVVYLAQHLLWILAWVLIARTALLGRPDPGLFLAWCLVLLTIVPLRAAVTWSEGILAAGFGSLLKQRLLDGILSLSIEDTRRQGIGQFLGRVMESQAIESLALHGGILGILALIELAVATAVLALGPAPWWQCASLILWLGLAAWLSFSYARARRAWSAMRVSLTHDTVERMVGHKTRLVQEAPEHRHEHEDQSLWRYLEASRLMDRAASRLLAGVPRGWVLLGLAGLMPAFLSGVASPEALAIGLGGVLLALQAFERFSTGSWHLAGSTAAWDQVAALYHASTSQPERPAPLVAATAPSGTPEEDRGNRTLLHVHDVVFRHRPGSEPILRGCSVDVHEKDRIVLQGPSGSGKSTFAAVLSGLRKPEAGLILSRGLDLASVGRGEWRRRVALAPQLHENHVFSESLAFNLLLGRRWPPRLEDLEEADSVCRDLGLGPLLKKMPSGLLQMIGESGWQLSHGEQSRMFVARALLQRADLVVLDESLGALDPLSQRLALDCLASRSNSLLLIAHF